MKTYYYVLFAQGEHYHNTAQREDMFCLVLYCNIKTIAGKRSLRRAMARPVPRETRATCVTLVIARAMARDGGLLGQYQLTHDERC